VTWLYGGGEARLSGAAYSVQLVPPPAEFAAVIDDLVAQGYRWLLADGPRRVRAHWILDPWWIEQPQMLPSLQQATQASCVALADLRDALLRAA